MTTNNDFCDKNEEKPNDYVKKSHNEQDLTEQWKRGELEEGLYYIGNGKHTALAQYERKSFYTLDSNIPNTLKENAEVLAPVPSYEQWQSLNEIIDSMNDTNKALAHRLNMLKELLKDLRELIGNNFLNHEMRILLTEIDEALK